MSMPVLIDTDVGLDDAIALALALASRRLDVRAIVATGLPSPHLDAETHLAQLVAALARDTPPPMGRGLSAPGHAGEASRETIAFDRLAPVELPEYRSFQEVYREAIEAAHGHLRVITLGPLTSLAAVLADERLANGIEAIHVRGGAVWVPGDAARHAESNFLRDPAAAAAVLTARRPVTLAPLDATRFARLDESHAAHLCASTSPAAQTLAVLLSAALDARPARGDAHIDLHDPVVIGGLLWPELFVHTRLRVEVVTKGQKAGQSRPALGGNAAEQVDVMTALRAVDFLENMLGALCREAFVV